MRHRRASPHGATPAQPAPAREHAMTEPFAICDFTYTKKTFREYFKLREHQNSNIMWIVLAVITGATTALFIWFLFDDGFNVGAIFCAAVCAFATAICIYSAVKPSEKPDHEEMHEFFRRHGCNVDVSNHWQFRERVEVAEDGIKISFGPVGCPDSKLCTLSKPWELWKSVETSKEMLVVLCENDVANRTTAFSTPNSTSLENAGLYRQRRCARDLYEDAVLPVDALEGMDAERLAKVIGKHIWEARKNANDKEAATPRPDRADWNGREGATEEDAALAAAQADELGEPLLVIKKADSGKQLLLLVPSFLLMILSVNLPYQTILETLIPPLTMLSETNRGSVAGITELVLFLACFSRFLTRIYMGANQQVTVRENVVDVEYYTGVGWESKRFRVRGASNVKMTPLTITVWGQIDDLEKDRQVGKVKLMRVYGDDDEKLMLEAIRRAGTGASTIDEAVREERAEAERVAAERQREKARQTLAEIKAEQAAEAEAVARGDKDAVKREEKRQKKQAQAKKQREYEAKKFNPWLTFLAGLCSLVAGCAALIYILNTPLSVLLSVVAIVLGAVTAYRKPNYFIGLMGGIGIFVGVISIISVINVLFGLV